MSKLRSIGGILRSSLVLNQTLKQPQQYQTQHQQIQQLQQKEELNHTGTVIFLHGLGERAQLWNDILLKIQSNGNQHLKFICPNSLTLPVDRYESFPIRSWFNYKTLGEEYINDINYSRATVQTIIENEIKQYNIPSNRILLAGFGQGAALALYTFYTQKNKNDTKTKYIFDEDGKVIEQLLLVKDEDSTDDIHLDGGYSLAGCLSLSGYIPLTKYFREKTYYAVNVNQPLLMFHGDQDNMIDISLGKKSFKFLNNILGCTNSELIIYKGLGDGVCENQIEDISLFLKKVLPNT